MEPTSRLVSPAEIDVLMAYIKKLRDNSIPNEEKTDPRVSFHPLDVARRIISFYINRDKNGLSVSFGGTRLNMDYFSDIIKTDWNLSLLLSEPNAYIEEMANDYHKILATDPRHYVLSKSIDKLTGYDLQKIISYTIEDLNNK